MVVPAERLLWWVAGLVVPAATVAGVWPAAAPAACLVLAVALALCLIDAARAGEVLDGLAAEAPATTRFTVGRPGQLDLRLCDPRRRGLEVRLGVAWPESFGVEAETLRVRLPTAAEVSTVGWRCTPGVRGCFGIDACWVASLSPWGLWETRRRLPCAAQLLVYPNLHRERRHLAAYFLNRGAFGVHAQRQIGQGREFEKLRDYLPGDCFDHIHWKATAKRGRPVTKEFQIERTQEVYVVVDASRLSARAAGTGEAAGAEHPAEPFLERYITAALVLGLAAARQGDLFGLVTFSDRIHTFLRARGGRAHYWACRDALFALQPSLVNPDFEELCSFLRVRLRRRALLVVLTSLDDPVLMETFARSVGLVSRQHLVLANMLTPAAVAPLFQHANVAGPDDLYTALGGHLVWQDLQEFGRTLQRQGVRLSMLDDARLCAQLVAQYVRVKQRQQL